MVNTEALNVGCQREDRNSIHTHKMTSWLDGNSMRTYQRVSMHGLFFHRYNDGRKLNTGDMSPSGLFAELTVFVRRFI